MVVNRNLKSADPIWTVDTGRVRRFFFWLISPTNILSGVRPIFFYKKIYRSICPNHPILFYQYILNKSCQLEKQKYPWKNSKFFQLLNNSCLKKDKDKINWGLLEQKSHNWNNFFSQFIEVGRPFTSLFLTRDHLEILQVFYIYISSYTTQIIPYHEKVQEKERRIFTQQKKKNSFE